MVRARTSRVLRVIAFGAGAVLVAAALAASPVQGEVTLTVKVDGIKPGGVCVLRPGHAGSHDAWS